MGSSPAPEYYYGDMPRRGSLAVFQDPIADVFPGHSGPEETTVDVHGHGATGVGISGVPVISEPGDDEDDVPGDASNDKSEKKDEKKASAMPWGQIFVLLCVTLSESVQVQILVGGRQCLVFLGLKTLKEHVLQAWRTRIKELRTLTAYLSLVSVHLLHGQILEDHRRRKATVCDLKSLLIHFIRDH